MTYAERAAANNKADALFNELHTLMGRMAFAAARPAENFRGAPKGVQIVEVALEGTLTGDDLTNIGQFCKARQISFWGVTGRAGERGYMFFDVFNYQPTI